MSLHTVRVPLKDLKEQGVAKGRATEGAMVSPRQRAWKRYWLDVKEGNHQICSLGGTPLHRATISDVRAPAGLLTDSAGN